MRNKRNIDLCLTPSMIDLFDLSRKQVIIIDVFRATSAMCVFLNNGGKEVVPVSTIEEAKKYKNKMHSFNNLQCLVAAERNGAIVPGFDLGNSPLLYHGKKFKDMSLVITTTNGTLAINKSKHAGSGMLLASFLNANAVVDYVCRDNESDILIVCSGWKGLFCVEDVLLAGFLSQNILLNDTFFSNSDSIFLAQELYASAQSNLFGFLSNSSYRKRMNLDEDVQYCLQRDIMNIVPVWFQNSSYGGFNVL